MEEVIGILDVVFGNYCDVVYDDRKFMRCFHLTFRGKSKDAVLKEIRRKLGAMVVVPHNLGVHHNVKAAESVDTLLDIMEKRIDAAIQAPTRWTEMFYETDGFSSVCAGVRFLANPEVVQEKPKKKFDGRIIISSNDNIELLVTNELLELDDAGMVAMEFSNDSKSVVLEQMLDVLEGLNVNPRDPEKPHCRNGVVLMSRAVTRITKCITRYINLENITSTTSEWRESQGGYTVYAVVRKAARG